MLDGSSQQPGDPPLVQLPTPHAGLWVVVAGLSVAAGVLGRAGASSARAAAAD